ncbi:hypothetical protein EDC01DRAFT_636050 [Geopyxis carbonaria]|nr:hypothetical protein EDC01DRAFT_636050 [Geopyxis carbonaria]
MPPTTRRSRRLQESQEKETRSAANNSAATTPELAIQGQDTQDDIIEPDQASLPPQISTMSQEDDHNINTFSSTLDIHNYLSSIDLPGWFVYPHVISFNDEAHKGNQIQRNHRSLVKGNVSEDYVDYYYKDLDRCHSLTTAYKHIKTTGTILWLSGSMWQIENQGQMAWHSFLFIYRNRKVILVDPDYATGEGKLRLTSLGGGLELGRKLIRMMEANRRRIDLRMIGKGIPEDVQSTGANCNDLVYQCLQQFVKDGGHWEDRNWAAEGYDIVYK